jgi:nucleoside-diphosphate-sugar epimerase
MTSAIIGSNGFLGKSLKRYADKFLDEEWVGITRENYSMWAGSKQWNRVVWCAGMSSKIQCEKNKEQCYQANYLDLLKVLVDFKFEQFIFISSFDVYPEDIDEPVEEDASEAVYISPRLETAGLPAPKISAYGVSKRLGEMAVAKIAQNRKKNFAYFRCNGFTGPNLSKNVIYDLTRPEPQLFVSWDSKFQYMHVNKFAELLFILAGHVNNDVINVTSPDVVTPADVANLLDVDFKKVRVPGDRVVPTVNAVMDVTKLERILNNLNIFVPSSREAILNWDKPLY